jgi:lauroyl/myristoyl acyltransferase
MTKLGQRAHIERANEIVAINFAVVVMDRLRFLSFLLLHRVIKRFIKRYSPPIGVEKLSAALSRGRGAIVFSCHVGPYYLIPGVLTLMGHRVTAVEKFGLIASPIVERQVRKLNGSLGNGLLQTATVYDGQLLRKLKRCLNEGEIVFMMGDYHGSGEDEAKYVKFLGYDIIPGRGLAWLHRETGAPLIPIVFTYDNGKPHLEVLEEVEVDNAESVNEITQKIYKKLEQRILQEPERWALWLDYHLMLSKEARATKCSVSSA